MLTIRDAQMQSLQLHRRSLFVERAVRRLRELFPEESQGYRDAELRAAAEAGVERADTVYGLRSERDVMRFLAIMWCFGARFDDDPSLPWVREALRDARFEALFEAARAHAEEGLGLRLRPSPVEPPEPEAPPFGPADYAEDYDQPAEENDDEPNDDEPNDDDAMVRS